MVHYKIAAAALAISASTGVLAAPISYGPAEAYEHHDGRGLSGSSILGGVSGTVSAANGAAKAYNWLKEHNLLPREFDERAVSPEVVSIFSGAEDKWNEFLKKLHLARELQTRGLQVSPDSFGDVQGSPFGGSAVSRIIGGISQLFTRELDELEARGLQVSPDSFDDVQGSPFGGSAVSRIIGGISQLFTRELDELQARGLQVSPDSFGDVQGSPFGGSAVSRIIGGISQLFTRELEAEIAARAVSPEVVSIFSGAEDKIKELLHLSRSFEARAVSPEVSSIFSGAEDKIKELLHLSRAVEAMAQLD